MGGAHRRILVRAGPVTENKGRAIEQPLYTLQQRLALPNKRNALSMLEADCLAEAKTRRRYRPAMSADMDESSALSAPDGDAPDRVRPVWPEK